MWVVYDLGAGVVSEPDPPIFRGSGSETRAGASLVAIFEFGRGFYGDTYISVLLDSL